MEIGLIADTHGLLRQSAIEALAGVQLLLHAGDVGKSRVDQLAALAPVHAVRGNVDRGVWADQLPLAEITEIAGVRILVTHRLADVPHPYPAQNCHAIVTGHSHRPEIRWVDGILLINPGSAGPRRFNLPITVARISITDGKLEARLVALSL